MLKRNRTLKVLNLSENKIDVQGLVAIAEALVSQVTFYALISLAEWDGRNIIQTSKR